VPRATTPTYPTRMRRGALLVLVLAAAGCAHAPPPPPEPVAEPVAPPEPTCDVSPEPDCRPFGDCAPQEVIGRVCHRTVQPEESLIEMARRYDLGFNVIESANPGLDAYVPTPGAKVTIPTAWIVPRAAAPGTMVVNLSEMRLYLFPASPGAPMSFPVGVGSEGWRTPVGAFTVIQKQEHPRWYPPASIRRENPDLPAMVPPGPENPLGTHALRLSRGSLLIHGTDTPFAVGRRASHGCLRLYPEDIPFLFERVPVGTKVTIVREPVKVGVKEDRVFVEVHADDDARVDYRKVAKRLLGSRGVLDRVDAGKLESALKDRTGYPVDVTAEVVANGN
jgi:L,D-transpeptidase ErfK/SrfK